MDWGFIFGVSQDQGVARTKAKTKTYCWLRPWLIRACSIPCFVFSRSLHTAVRVTRKGPSVVWFLCFLSRVPSKQKVVASNHLATLHFLRLQQHLS